MFEENPLNILLASFFYENGYLRLPGLGRFDLSDEKLSAGNEQHGGHALPQSSITFSYNPEEGEDPELIDFITSHTRKMKALAASDLESLSESAREMLNIRQSYTFTGIATIIPTGQGSVHVVPEKIPAGVHSNKAVAPEMFHQGKLNPVIKEKKVHSPGGYPSMGGIVITGVCIVVIALLVYFLFFHRTISENHVLSDKNHSTVTALPATDSESQHKIPSGHQGIVHYEVVFEHGDREKAFHRYRQLTGWGHHIIMRTNDSILFTLAVPVTTSATDTAAMKDSIRALYGHPVYIRYKFR